MTLHAKGYLPLLLLLLLLLLPGLVVSRNPRQLIRPFNEGPTTTTTTVRTTIAPRPSFELLPPTSWAEKQAAGGLMIGSRALIARPEKRSIPGAISGVAGFKKPKVVMVVRHVRDGAEGYLAATRARLHQQSTNSAAAKRDLQYNKQRTVRGLRMPAKAISGYFISAMYYSPNDFDNLLHGKRIEGQYLPGAINALVSDDELELSFGDDEHRENNGFLPPRIIYVGQALPEPFVHQKHRERGRVFGLSNFLIKGRPPMAPRSFDINERIRQSDEDGSDLSMTEKDGVEATSSSEMETTTLPPATTQLPSRGFALHHHVAGDNSNANDFIEKDVFVEEENDSPTVPSFEDNFAVDDELASLTTTTTTAKSRDFGDEDYDIPDWDVSESQKREVVHDPRDTEGRIENENNSGEYEFGYRVIHHATGNDFGHAESRRQGRMTEGRYHVLLPDGRVQRVEYSVGGDTGFRAKVSFEAAEKSGRMAKDTMTLVRDTPVAAASSPLLMTMKNVPEMVTASTTRVSEDTPVAVVMSTVDSAAEDASVPLTFSTVTRVAKDTSTDEATVSTVSRIEKDTTIVEATTTVARMAMDTTVEGATTTGAEKVTTVAATTTATEAAKVTTPVAVTTVAAPTSRQTTPKPEDERL